VRAMGLEVIVIESQPTVINLTEAEASLLGALGRELAGNRSWWGSTGNEAGGSVIGLERLAGERCRATFRDVVGVVRIGARQIQVLPKIPLTHFFYLASRSELAPRVATHSTMLDDGIGFVELLCRWCVDAAEQLLRHGLRKDYCSTTNDLAEVRGRVLTFETAIESLRGRAVAICEFDELSDDAPLNRIVRSACERISRLDTVSDKTRHRARLAAYRMDGVGHVQFADLRVKVDRLSNRYLKVIPLAVLILAGCGISSSLGAHAGSAFLVRTPELIEDGLRAVLSEALPELGVTKRRLMLGDTGLSMNPDLVIGTNLAVGDVKYRFLGSDWSRADLNQVVAFATAFQCRQCGLFGFVRDQAAPIPRPAPVGTVKAMAFGWLASASVTPQESASQLSTTVKRWLARPPP
jgi:5-methylcytosine-specific restriction enzyme subunit McrC